MIDPVATDVELGLPLLAHVAVRSLCKHLQSHGHAPANTRVVCLFQVRGFYFPNRRSTPPPTSNHSHSFQIPPRWKETPSMKVVSASCPCP